MAEVCARLRVEVEAQLVRVLGVLGEARPDVEASVPRFTAQAKWARSATTIASEVVPFGVLTMVMRSQSGRFFGTRFWKNDGPPAPSGRRCQQTEVEGRATYDAASDRLVSLELRRLVTAPQLPLYEESQEFWAHPSVEELARRRPAAATSDSGLLRDDEASDPEIDAFLAALQA